MSDDRPTRSVLLALLEALKLGLGNILTRACQKLEARITEKEEGATYRGRELEEHEGRFSSFIHYVPDIVAVFGPEGALRYANLAVEQVLGYKSEDLVDSLPLGLLHPDDVELVASAFAEGQAKPGANPPVEIRIRHANGSWRCLEAFGNNLLDDPFVGGVVVVFRDITERKALEERLQHQAFHDALTGLPNRALFMDRLGQALSRTQRRERSVAILFLDLDNFKFVNDSLGHEEGDRLLVEVAERLCACVRPEDTIARLGGDEYTILLEDARDASDGIRVAGRIVEALRAPFNLKEQEVLTSASIGIVLGTAAAKDGPGDLLRKADLALYGAKNKGKARYEVFEEEMTRRSARRLEMEGNLIRALERDEFTVLYQPKILLENDTIVGMEALVRWEHPERGLITPPEFVPFAEEIGLIIPIGHKVLEKACRQARAWQEHYTGTPQTVYVNLSAKQFNDPGLVEKVTKAILEAGVEPDNLALEIAENVLMCDAKSAASRLKALRTLGVRVVVDDFGTAYSSLSHLGHFPMDFLNIDRSLTLRLGVDHKDTAIVSAMIGLAHALGWEVTAEGVETADQLAQLRELGCDMAQGNYLWEPSSSSEVSMFLSATNEPG